MGLKALRHTHVLAILLCLSLILLTRTVDAQVSYRVTISVRGLPAGFATTLYVNGKPNGTLTSSRPVTLAFPSTGVTQFLSVQFNVPNETGVKGVRYAIPASSQQWSFSGAGNHTFVYVTQYLLSVQTPYSFASGEDWYPEGAIAHAMLNSSQVVDEGQRTRHIFAGWTRDASGGNLTSDNILMNSPKTAIASWKTQFLLSINSDPPVAGGLQGQGWYDAGTQATFSASPVQVKDDSRFRFDAWKGDYSGQSTRGTIIMDRSRAVTAHFVAQYLVAVQYDPQSIALHYNETHAGWYDAGSSVQLGPVQPLIGINPVTRLKFSNWVDNGQPLDSLSVRVTVDKPKKISLIFTTQYYVDVKTSHGSVAGSGWYDSGATAKITEMEESNWLVSYTFAGWETNPGGIVRNDDPLSLVVDQPYTVQATWNVNYLPLIALLGGGSAASAILAASVLLIRKRRGSLKVEPAERICKMCGSNIPLGAAFCQKCLTPLAPSVTSLEEKVYDYILKHEGVISLSKAADELGITVEQVKEVAERLKAEGRLA